MKSCVLAVVLVFGMGAIAQCATMRYNFGSAANASTKVKTKKVVKVRTSDQIDLGGNGAFRWSFWQRRSNKEAFQR